MKRNRMNNLVALVVSASALMLVAGAAQAEVRKYDETRSAKAKGTVVIENIVGSIEIQGWDKNEVHATGTLGDDVKDVEFEAQGQTTKLKVVYPKHAKSLDDEDGANLVIKVPRGCRVEVECVSAPITLSFVEGPISASSVSGSVKIDGGEDEVHAASVSGDVDLRSQASQVRLETVSGSITARGGTAEVEASVVSGTIDLRYDEFRGCDVNAVSGEALVSGDFGDRAECDINVHSGDIVLTVPVDVAADFEVNTFSGDIENAFGQKAQRTSQYAPGRELEFSVNGGGARIHINSFSGTVDIRKK